MTSPEGIHPPTESTGGVDDWDSHWDAFGDAAAENPANAYRRNLVLQKLRDLPAASRVLDIGSGPGALTLAVAADRPDLSLRGLEYSESGVARSRLSASRVGSSAEFYQRDLLLEPASNEDVEWADAAICSEVLEHLDDPLLFLRNSLTYIKPGGRVIVTVPSGPRSALDLHIGHRRHYDPRSLQELLAKAGLKEIRVQRAGFPFFNLYRLAIIVRGRALISDIDASTSRQRGKVQARLRTVSRIFAKLFERNLPDSPLGWQLVATASLPTG